MSEQAATRRSFLAKLLAGTLLAGAGGFIASIIAYLFPPSEVSSALGPERVRIGKVADVPVGQGKLALVEDQPVWVIHLTSGFVAMAALCTHKGCIIKWNEGRRLFVCPCHEGLFDTHGNVVAGLPRLPLSRFRVGIVQDELYVGRGTQES